MKALLILTIVLTSSLALSAQVEIPAAINGLLTKNICNTCHKLNEKLVGPSYIELAQKDQTVEEVSKLIKEPVPSNWPDYPPMATMPYLNDKEVKRIAEWIVSLRD